MRRPIRDLLAAALPLVGIFATCELSYDPPFGLPVLPLMIAAYIGGGRGGAIATAITSIAALAMSIAPIKLAAVLVAGGLATVVGELLCRLRQRAERSEHMYNRSFHASPVPLVLHRLSTGRIVDANEAYTRLTGWTREELLASDAERPPKLDQLVRDRELRDVPVQILRKTGEPRQTLVSAVIVEVDGVEHGLTTIIDMTDHQRAESNARDFEQRFRELADTIDEVFWINDAQMSRVYYVSPAYERVWGRSCARLYESPREWIDAVHP